MSQHDMNIANQDFPSTRSDLNNALAALASTSSGSSAPSTTFANQLFYNSSTNILSIRNEDNDAFIPIALLDQSNDAITEIQCRGIGFSDGDNAMTIADGGACTFPQDVTGLTFNPTGDTSAGDAAAIGKTAAEGLILTGQGSATDVTIKNDADATVASIATGTTVFTINDDITVVGRAVGSTITSAANAQYDLSLGNNFTTTTAGTVTMNFSNVAVGQSGCIKFVNGGGHSVQVDTIVGISAAGFAALSVTGTYFLTYFVTASSGANSVLVGVSGAIT